MWIEASRENAERVMRALRAFGAPLGDLVSADFETPGIGFKMGIPPRRIDILTKIEGISFEDAWPNRQIAVFSESLKCPVIGIEDLIANKRAAGRPQDVADVAALEKILRARQR